MRSSLFPDLEKPAVKQMPPGFFYQEEFLSPAAETQLAERLASLDLRPFEFHGYQGNRRVVSFGYRYDFSKQAVEAATAIPPFLLTLREQIAQFRGRSVAEFAQVGIQEYAAGAGIGWHKDRPQFGEVVGVSLVASAPMRLRRRQGEGEGWQRATQQLAPRSVYVLSGEARSQWEHSIPAMETLRYSITFRTLAPGFAPTNEVAK